MFGRTRITKSTTDCSVQIPKLKTALDEADALVIGAGAGLSTSAGFTYNGERFHQYFADFEAKYGFHDMYAGGFYPYHTPEEHWAYWSRYIRINRYMDAPKPVYEELFRLVKGKDCFVITTNVDHCFQKAGFDKKRLFYTQGDYGLFQCSEPCCRETFDNEKLVRQMVEAQGYQILPDGSLSAPKSTPLKTTIPSELVPHCPHCGRPMNMNLRADNTFVEDEGWHRAAERYSEFLRRHEGQNILKQAVIPLRVEQALFVKARFLETMVYVGGQHKIVLVFHKGKQVLIHRLGRILIAIDVNIAAPVSPVFFQRRIWIKAAGVHIPDAVLCCKIRKILLKSFSVIGETCRGRKPCTCTNDHCIGMAQDLPQCINRSGAVVRRFFCPYL